MKILLNSLVLTATLIISIISSYLYVPSFSNTEWAVLKSLMIITIISIIYTFVVGELTSNNSQVDKLWSILPIIYVWIIAYFSNFNGRLVLMGLLVTVWGVRLTVNFALKGAYQWKFWGGKEDYRWLILRERNEFKPSWKWSLFNLFFICGYQNILILLFTLPALVAFQFKETALGTFDFVAFAMMFLFIIFEAVADFQQWKFQQSKWKLHLNAKTVTTPFEKGFLDKGLWAYSRHPNYFAEQSIWLSFYLFSCSASGQPLNWSIAGVILLILLFQGSARFSEEISKNKYPEYNYYQQTVSKFLPLPIHKK